MRFGPSLLRQADLLATISEEPGRITRTYLTPQHREAGELIAGSVSAGRYTALTSPRSPK